MEKLRIIISGFIGLYPTGGAAWDYAQYPLGFKALGHEVYYVEDTAQYPVFQLNESLWNDCSESISFLNQTMINVGLKDQWAYRDVASDKWFGMSENKIKEVFETADVFINVSASTYLREEYLKIPIRILIDSDPMFTQIQVLSNLKLRMLIDLHTHYFTFGENILSQESRIPLLDKNWNITRQPICLEQWKTSSNTAQRFSFTTVMNWSEKKALNYDGENWGQKDSEFEKIKALPKSFKNIAFKIVVNYSERENKLKQLAELQKYGWIILDPHQTVKTMNDYRCFIQSSTAEFSVAKETYVKANTGWFSCRSACYLAMGKPVITQETGWSKYIPSGLGLFAFTDNKSAVEALAEITKDVTKQSTAAREIAEEYFDSNKVLVNLLESIY